MEDDEDKRTEFFNKRWSSMSIDRLRLLRSRTVTKDPKTITLLEWVLCSRFESYEAKEDEEG